MKPGDSIYEPLHRNVLAVATIRHDGWCAYTVQVPGKNHDDEKELWRDEGRKLPELVARSIFPDLKNQPYAH